jgi:hypothetical protein
MPMPVQLLGVGKIDPFPVIFPDMPNHRFLVFPTAGALVEQKAVPAP